MLDCRAAHWWRRQPQLCKCYTHRCSASTLTCGPACKCFLNTTRLCIDTDLLQHAFPQDFRSGPSLFDWDPSKWIILLLHRLGLAHGLRKARDEDLARARWRMECKHSHHAADSSDDEQSSIGEEAVMTAADVFAYVEENKGSSVLLINGAVVDATAYLHEHVGRSFWLPCTQLTWDMQPGGALLLRKYAVKTSATMQSDDSATRGRLAKELHHKATQAFQGGMNKHSRAAHDKLRELTVARFEDD